jgi:hypothetical protein
MRGLAMALFIFLMPAALALGSCGGDKTTDQRAKSQPTAATGATAPPAKEPGESSIVERRKRLIYDDAKALCSAFGVQRVVSTFHLRSGDARTVARRYATENYSGQYEEIGYRGCLAGFLE